MKIISGKPLPIKLLIILIIIFYALSFLISNNLLRGLSGTLGLFFLLDLIVLSILRLINYGRNHQAKK